MLKAYTTFKAVRLDAGENKVIFKFNPYEFYVGAFISVIFLMLFGAYYIIYRRKNG